MATAKAAPVANATQASVSEMTGKVEKLTETMIKSTQDASARMKDDYEAFVKASTIMAQGLEQVTKDLYQFTETGVERQISTTKALMAANSVRELMDIQSNFLKTGFNSLQTESTKLNEQLFALVKSAVEPLTKRAEVNMKAFKSLTKAA
jgi:phasin family protein